MSSLYEVHQETAILFWNRAVRVNYSEGKFQYTITHQGLYFLLLCKGKKKQHHTPNSINW